MKLGTLAAWLDVSEPTVRDLEQRGIIPKRNAVLGTFDSEAVLKALAEAAGGKSDEAERKTLDYISGAPRARRRNGT